MTWLFNYDLGAFRDGSFVFLSPVPGELRLLAFGALAALLWVLYRRVRGRVPERQRRLLLGLRLAALTVLAFMLGMPALRVAHLREGGAFTAFLVDGSRSMGIADAATNRPGLTRAAAALELLDGGVGSLPQSLDGCSTPIFYAFDGQARRIDGPAQAGSDGAFTNPFRAIRDSEAELRNLPLASVVFVGDGCRNQGGSALEAARLLQARGVPLHTIGIGHEPPPRDYEVVRADAPRRVRRNSEVEVLVTVRHTDYPDPFDLQIAREGSVLMTQRVTPDPDSDTRQVRFAFTPDHQGTATYRIQIPAAPDESVTANNVRDFTIEIQDDRLPVLYVEGSPRLEYRFLRRAMYRDPDFRVVGLLRLAEKRFYVQGADDSEAYLSEGFPTTAEQLFAFQALILGDIEASYFSAEQLRLIESFVRERGGGLLMLGGVNSFGLGGYAGTPVERALPVRMAATDRPYSDDLVTARLADGALEHPVMRVAADTAASRADWETAPRLIGITPLAGIKSGATLLLRDEAVGLPILAVQNYGAGRTAAFTSGGSWYWQVSRPASDEFHERVWKQLIRWLVVGARDHLSVETDADTYARRDPVLVRAAVYGTDLRPLNDARVTATFTDPLGNHEPVPMDWTLAEEGVYQCRYVPEREGDYTVTVQAEGLDARPAAKGFLVAEPTVEFSDAGLKRDLLRDMARTTGGLYCEYPDVSGLAARLRADAMDVQHRGAPPETLPLWDMPVLLVLLLVLLGAEWFLRRRKGLS